MRSKSILVSCRACGKQFRAYVCRRAIGKGTYCSKSCVSSHSHLRPAAERFWKKVSRTDDLFSCWEFRSSTYVGGYGVFVKSNEERVGAHRFSWELHFGPIPEGLWVLHRCDNPACVRPDHLFLGDHAANMADMAAKGRAMRGERHNLSKLTEEQVRTIRRLYAAGISQTALARRFDVTQNVVGCVVRRETWKHVD